MKRRKRIKKNQGNSFIMVVATVSFLAVLVAAILVAVALCYRLKAYDINARDNFYYLEQAMDEIYAGVGGDSMQILNQAYDDTLEVMVYYDTKKRAYVTMDNAEANEILKSTYMKMLQDDSRYQQTTVANRLKEFLSYPYNNKTENGKEGINLSIDKVVKETDELIISNLKLERRAKYSTVNARSRKDSAEAGGKAAAAQDTFIQTITTDLVINKPAFDVNFNANNSDLSDLYEFSMIADMGIEIVGKDDKTALGNKVNITGNVYAASDFYNKRYNEEEKKLVTVNDAATTVKEEQIQKVTSYDNDRLKKCDGVNTKSMYSGLYVDGATVVMASERIIVPGSLAALNCADVTISSIANSSADYADMWVDGLVLDGYALRQDKDGKVLKGASLTMKARAYVYDDLEVNANSGNVLLNGEYYGYNYASTDNRTYTSESIKNGTRRFTTNTNAGITDGQGVEGQAHYNSSAIILNGENATLDFASTNALYVAGQSYIELSKTTTESKDAETISYTVTDGKTVENMTDEVKTETDSYLTTETKDGEITDNYTVKTGKTGESDKTPIQDYRTGEAISIKSNQLAYIPDGMVYDKKDGLWLKLPARLRDLDLYKDIWSDFDKIPIVKTVVSGKTKYFFDFSKADVKNKDVMNQFIADYAALFDESTIAEGSELTTGEAYGLTNITDYEYFEVKMLRVGDEKDPYANIYTNSAITTKVGDTFTIVANSDNKEPLLRAAANINSAIDEGRNVQAGITIAEGETATVASAQVSAKLQDQYKETKWLLTNKSDSGEFVTEAHTLKEEVITPLNHYFDFNIVKNKGSRYCAMQSGYGVWISDEDVKIGASSYTIGTKKNSYSTSFKNGKVRGIVIAMGDVTFEDDVTEFEGLIVSGSKIIIDNFDKVNGKTTMSFLANEEIVKTVLRECDSSRGEAEANNFGFVCDIFRLFESQYVAETESTDTAVVSMKSVSAIQFEDILSFRNWKKNVD